jgi:hypothetical protein
MARVQALNKAAHLGSTHDVFLLCEKGVLDYNPPREVRTEKVRRAVGTAPAFETEEIATLC